MSPRSVSISISPDDALFTQPVSIRVTGVDAATPVKLSLTHEDAVGVVWRATADFTSDAHGELSVCQSASLGGSYTGARPRRVVVVDAPRRRF